ncbi:sialidase family protein [Nakamurella aerolata]|uniref:exo-alpha-sialidase n=1 Tax=Nakamurella aerolata TaxID=1656892 RepID=A0A849A6N1_9ACTN|nr:sialidase family protein [Nakamurella aerolata]NNG35103.1 exo-alpha-sialidase [Nakamurella aerolata]
MNSRKISVVSVVAAVTAVCATAVIAPASSVTGAPAAADARSGSAGAQPLRADRSADGGQLVAAKPGGRCTQSVPYPAGDNGYASFRIPAVVTTTRGTVLAFAEGRHAGTADSGDIDVVLKRSSDGGCSWSELAVVSDGDGDTRGNPAPAVDPATGAVVLVTTFNGGNVTEKQILKGEVAAEDSRRVFVQTSANDGVNFTAPREITASTKRADWRWYASGPGHATVLTTGPHRGRIVVPANHSIAPPAGSGDQGDEAKYYGGHSIYSDDRGKTWQIGYVDDNPDGFINVNETAATQLLDGRMYFNTREHNGSAPGNRADAYSTDGGQTLVAPFAPQATLVGPVVQGSVLQVKGGGKSRSPLLYSGPADPGARAAMTIRVSRDAGVTFSDPYPISGLPAAYSDLVQLNNSTIGLLYETGARTSTDTIVFRKIDLAELIR